MAVWNFAIVFPSTTLTTLRIGSVVLGRGYLEPCDCIPQYYTGGRNNKVCRSQTLRKSALSREGMSAAGGFEYSNLTVEIG